MTLRILSLRPGRSHPVRDWLVLAPPFTDDEIENEGKEVTAKLSLISSFAFTITLSLMMLVIVTSDISIHLFTPLSPLNIPLRQAVIAPSPFYRN